MSETATGAAADLDRVAALEAAGDADGARRLCAALVTERPDDVAAVHRLGLLSHRLGDLTGAARYLARAIQLRPDRAPAFADLARLLRDLGQPDDAARAEQKAQALERAAAGVPDAPPAPPRPDPTARLHAALEHHRAGRVADAEAIYAEVLAGAPDNADALYLSAVARRSRGRTEEALALVRRALAAQPVFPGAHNTHGNLLRDLGRLDEAVAAFRTAIEQQPDYAEAYDHLGSALVLQGRIEPAVTALERAIALSPGLAGAHNDLGVALNRQGRYAQAIDAFRRALALQPDYPQAYNNLGQTLAEQGERDAALACYRSALTLKPDYAGAHSNVIYALESDPRCGTAESQAERRRWYAAHRLPARDPARPWPNPRAPERRLRVGYVSADFRRHSAAFTFSPVIWNHDRARFDVTCYSAVAVEDGFTARFRQASDRWRNTIGLSDEQLAAQIAADGIDILVDLSGHTAGNRLRVFTMKAAPVQVTAWAGVGTGIPEIDWLFSDPVITPPAERPLLAERVADLPCAFAYLPPDDTPAVAPLPAAAGGGVTFGCFNRFAKASDEALGAWAEILRRTPDSRLLLKDKLFDEAAQRDRVAARFAAAGIDPARIRFRGWTDQPAHLASYGEIDLALDPFPHGGGVTTLEALWMGVPAVTRLGANQTGRTTAAILTTLGMTELIATDAAGYVALAVARATDRDWLARTRAGLRARMQASPIANPALYVAAVEALYRRIWREWCAGGVPSVDEAVALQRSGQVDAARGAYEAMLARDPDHLDANHLLGVILRQSGDLAGAERHIRRALAQRPAFAAAQNNLANVLRDLGRDDEALACFAEATRLAPQVPDPYVNMADLLVARRRFPEAIAALRTAVELRPDDARAWTLLGHALQSTGRIAEELAAFREALRLQPERAANHFAVAHALERLGDFAGAEPAYRQAVALDPGNPDLRNNMGALLLGQRRLEEARAEFEAAIARQPDNAAALSNLGTVLLKLGLQTDAATTCRKAVDSCLRRAPDSRDRVLASSFKNLLLVSVCRDDLDNAALEHLHREFGGLFGQPTATAAPIRDPRPDRPLRLGYLSADLQAGHPVVLNLRPILRAHDRSRFAVHVYASTARRDAVSDEIRAMVDGWRDIAHLDDREVAALIRDDEIDILVSVASRFDSNRPTVCTWRPAPVQISYGDVATTGLDAMGHIVADRRMIPPRTTEYFAERPLRLPKYYITEFPAELPPLRTAPREGPPRLGCFNNPSKITPSVLACWGRILAAVPDGRLALRYMDTYASEDLRRRTLDGLVAAGARPEQVEFAATPEHRTAFLERYNDLDLALDTFPFCGSTTTTTALAMGVPIVTWPWDRFVSRWTAWILRELGFPELVAGSADDYVARAVGALQDRATWGERRAEIRERLRNAPMCDGTGWTRGLERLYRAAWQARLREAAAPRPD